MEQEHSWSGLHRIAWRLWSCAGKLHNCRKLFSFCCTGELGIWLQFFEAACRLLRSLRRTREAACLQQQPGYFPVAQNRETCAIFTPHTPVLHGLLLPNSPTPSSHNHLPCPIRSQTTLNTAKFHCGPMQLPQHNRQKPCIRSIVPVYPLRRSTASVYLFSCRIVSVHASPVTA